MKTTRTRWFVALLALLALTAAACAAEGDDAADTATDDVEDAASEADEALDAAGSEAEEAQSEADEAVDEVTGTEGDAAPTDLGLASEGTIVVGSDIAFEPFESMVDGEPAGFDIDLMAEIASRLGLEVEYQNTPFDTIFTQLAGGSFDAIISAITITDERDETIDFSDPYFAANQALAVLEDSEITGVADLTGDSVVGVQSATTGADYASENFDAAVQEFPTSVDAFNALAAGQVDAVFIDLPVVGAQVEAGGGVVQAEEVDTGELYGIGVQEGNTALLDAINGALGEIIADGTYEEIYSTWFEGEVPSQFAAS